MAFILTEILAKGRQVFQRKSVELRFGRKPKSPYDKNHIGLCPELKLGWGRISHFLDEWGASTTDQWVRVIVNQGYSLELWASPHTFFNPSLVSNDPTDCDSVQNIIGSKWE